MPHQDNDSQHGSALSELDRALAELSGGQIDLDSVTPSHLHAKLVNGLWWLVCAEAVTASPHRLLGWFHNSDRQVTAVLAGQSGDDAADEPVLSAARAIAGIGVALAAARGSLPAHHLEPAVRWSVGYWLTAGVLTQSASAADLPDADLPDDVRTVLATIDQLPFNSARAYAKVVAVLLAAAVPLPRYRQRVRVLFDSTEADQAGQAGELELAVLPGGPPGLYPSPRTMAFLRGDRRFAAALTAAWTYAVGATGDQCVVWSITHSADRIPPISGGSLGAAFAVALADLTQPPWRHHVSLRAFSTTRAVTGTVASDGTIGPVGGLDRKFEAAYRRNWSVIAPHASRRDDQHGVPNGLTVHWVRDVSEARRRVTGWVRSRVIVTMSLVVLLITGTVVGEIVTHRVGADDTNASNAERNSTVQDLIDEADTQATDQPLLSVRLALAANALQDTPQTRSELISTLTAGLPHNTLVTGQGQIRAVAIGPNGVVLTGDDKGATLWNAASIARPVPLSTLDTAPIETAAMTADGNTVLLAPVDAAVLEFWDTTHPSAPRLTATVRTPCPPTSVAVNSLQRIALAGCADGTTTVWSFPAMTSPVAAGSLTPQQNGLHAVALDASSQYDGTTAVVASDHGISEWQIATSQGLRPPYAQYDNVELGGSRTRPAYSVAVSSGAATTILGEDGMTAEVTTPGSRPPYKPISLSLQGGTGDVVATALSGDGRRAITTGPTNSAVVWQLRDVNGISSYTPIAMLRQHSDTVVSVAISKDGKTAVTGSLDGSAALWDLSAQEPYNLTTTLIGFGGVKSDIGCSHQSSVCVTVTNGSAVVWDMSDPTAPQRVGDLDIDGSTARTVTFAPNSSAVAVGTTQGTTLWDLTTPDQPTMLSRLAADTPTNAVAFTPNGQALAAGGNNGDVVLWDISDLDRPRQLGIVPGQHASITTLTIDNTGHLLAFSDGGQVILGDITVPSHPRVDAPLPAEPGKVLDLTFSPTSPTLIQTNGNQQPPTVWDLGTPAVPKQVAKLTGHDDTVNSVTFNNSGTMALTASQDNTAMVWNMTNPNHPSTMTTLTGHTGRVLAAAFSSDGSTVVTSSADGTAIVWGIGPLVDIMVDPRRTACVAAGRPFTRQEWLSWVSNTLPYMNNC